MSRASQLSSPITNICESKCYSVFFSIILIRKLSQIISAITRLYFELQSPQGVQKTPHDLLFHVVAISGLDRFSWKSYSRCGEGIATAYFFRIILIRKLCQIISAITRLSFELQSHQVVQKIPHDLLFHVVAISGLERFSWKSYSRCREGILHMCHVFKYKMTIG